MSEINVEHGYLDVRKLPFWAACVETIAALEKESDPEIRAAILATFTLENIGKTAEAVDFIAQAGEAQPGSRVIRAIIKIAGVEQPRGKTRGQSFMSPDVGHA